MTYNATDCHRIYIGQLLTNKTYEYIHNHLFLWFMNVFVHLKHILYEGVFLENV